ncbi:MAG TPA: PAS domain S-box protein, partial [Pirellulales bacterium]|nr:PAS domain S-box protein [Pirellulales bacterium]
DVSEIEGSEKTLLHERSDESARSLTQTLLLLIFALTSTLVLMLASGVLLQRNLQLRQATADRLHAEREWLEVTLRSIGDGVIATDTQGKVLLLNSVAEALTGYRNSEAIGQDVEQVFRIVNENTRQVAANPVAKVLRDGKIAGLANHTLLISRDSSERPIDDSAAPIRSRNGDLLGVVLVFRDFSERREAEARLRQSLSELEELFENSPIGMHLMALDGTLLSVNRAELALLGRSSQERVGQPGEADYVDSKELQNMLARLGKGETIDSSDIQMRASDGSKRDVIVSANALWRDGQFVYSRWFIRDITERKRASNQLRFLAETGKTLGALVDHSSTLQRVARLSLPLLGDACVVDLFETAGRGRQVATAHTDHDRELLLGELHRQQQFDWSMLEPVSAAIRQGQPRLMERLSPEQVDRWATNERQRALLRLLAPVSLLVVPLFGRQGVRGVMAFLHSQSQSHFDLQDLELAQELARRTTTALENSELYEELREADRRKDEFLAMLAHELRNPLAAIQYANALSRASQGKVDEIDCPAMIEKQVHQLKRLIDDLLDVSRITRDRIQLKQSLVDIRDIIERAVDVARPLLAERQHHFQQLLPEESLIVLADPARLEQMIVNLLSNAAKYTPPQGRIEIRAQASGDRVLVKVRDSGVGIAPEKISQIFELFMQVDPSLERTEGGLGIGLTVVRKLVLLHGGNVEANSDGLGKGSEFTLWLPRATQQATASAEPAIAVDGDHRPLRILVVEDNVDTARGLALLLRQLGHEVRVCHEGHSALAAAIEDRPEVVLIDLGLPGMDGYQLATALRKQKAVRGARLIAISGYGQDEDRRRSLGSGFDEHLVKPVEFAVLRQHLMSVGRASRS